MAWKRHDELDYDKRDRELARNGPYFTHHLPVVLQHGPTCGIAALSSIILAATPSADFSSTANNLLSGAISMGLSNQGELMSVWYMSKLAEYAGLEHQVMDVDVETDIPALLRDSALLLVYDKDKNNEPTTRYSGEHAHWLLVTGFTYRHKLPPDRHKMPADRHKQTNMFPAATNCYSATRGSQKGPSQEHLHVFVQHGKSRLRQVWSWGAICESNENVRHAKPGDYVLPDSLHEHVAGKVVRVRLKL